MSYWWWIAIFLGGVALVAALAAVRRRSGTVETDRRREGFGSFVYYVLVDWWIN